MNKRLASMLTAFALTLSPVAVSAAEFTDSAENKDAPEIVGTPEATDPEIAAGLADGTITVSVIPVKDANDADTPNEIKEQLNQTLEEAKNAGTVADLAPGIAEAFEEAKKDNPAAADLTLNDLKVADIFDVSLMKDGEVLDVNSPVTFQVQTDLRPGDVFVVLHNADGTMEVVPATVDNSGVLTVTAPSLSPFILLVAEKAQTPAPGPAQPGTDNKPGTTTPGTPGTTTPEKPGTTTPEKPGTTTPEKPGTTKPVNKPAEVKPAEEEKAPATTGVATAANSNSMMAYVGAAAGLAGILLILKARKGLAK